MKQLKEKIITEGKVISDTVLKIDSFLNHQLDPFFLKEIGDEFARRFRDQGVTKILTVEASGIAVGLMTGIALNVPVLFAKKKQATTLDQHYFSSTIYSFTKKESVEIFVSKAYLGPEDKVLIIDDFLARGEALRGMLDIVLQANAALVGVGIVVEKAFQHGGEKLRAEGIRIESLARIASLKDGKVEFLD
ncbi:xanthine phosphoribosyltransferase [Desulfohalotomaculum tongense]|uniref:xanthine phosphoribosyltransferase n=1 Tax=Desulforadius tongensis TaxID=1216062 RepID=UPI00195CAC47|nr:xanthine phosphoribosyltransferase [Desulforadius tongensis]MBM7855915.1 xanthine phosphoribosyltransferase [Desulforadius tongensis]